MEQSVTPRVSRSHRAPVLLTATLLVGGETFAVKLRNLSENGVLVEADRLPPEGAGARFERKGLSVPCTVVWVEGRFAGVRFGRSIKSEDIFRNVPSPPPLQQPEFKRPGIACRPLTASERTMVSRWMNDASGRGVGD